MQAPAHYDSQDNSVMTTSDWFITQLVLSIPLVNIIMLFVWGFGGSGNLNRRNFCKAALIWAAIGIVLYILFFMAVVMISSVNQ